MLNVVSRLSSATAGAGEYTIVSGDNAGTTITLPTTPTPQDGTVNGLLNDNGSQPVTLSGGTLPIDHYGLVSNPGTVVIPPGMSVLLAFDATLDEWHVISGAFTPGYLLKEIQYAPTVQVAIGLVKGTLTALDTKNLTIPFVAPPSGVADLEVTLVAELSSTVNTSFLNVGLLDHTSGAIVGSQVRLLTEFAGGGVTNAAAAGTLVFRCAGLIPGPVQLDLAAAISNVAGAVGDVFAGNLASKTVGANVGPLVMRAIASV